MIEVDPIVIADQEDGSVRVSADVRVRRDTHRVWVEFPRGIGRPIRPANAFASCFLVPAMLIGEDLRFRDPISPRLLKGLGFLQDVYRCWERSSRRVEITAPPADPLEAAPSSNVGVFFSGGVDSMFSLIRHLQEVTHLVMVQGFDIPLDDEALWNETVKRMTDVAGSFDKELVCVRTNVRQMSDVYANWSLYHGGALATVGNMLGASIGHMYIGSTHTYRDLFPWGSHPLTDAQWSSEDVRFTHDGAAFSRVEKVAMIAGHDVALEHLRVCWKNPGGAFNCGRCEKCLRTMLNLEATGALERCPAFGQARLDPARVAAMPLLNENDASFARENLEYIETHGVDTPIAEPLRTALSRAGRMSIQTRAKRFVARSLPPKTRKFVANIVKR